MTNETPAPPVDNQPEPVGDAVGPDGNTIAATDRVSRWPFTPPKQGEIYGFIDPNHRVGMVAMTHETWAKINADIAALQQHAAKIRAENIVLIQEKEASGRGRLIVPT